MKKILLFCIIAICSVNIKAQFIPLYTVDTSNYVNYIMPKYYTQGCYPLIEGYLDFETYTALPFSLVYASDYTEIIAQPYYIDEPIDLKGIATVVGNGIFANLEENPHEQYFQIWNKDLTEIITQVRFDTIHIDYVDNIHRYNIEIIFDSTIHIDDTMFYVAIKTWHWMEYYTNLFSFAGAYTEFVDCEQEYPYLMVYTKGGSWIPLQETVLGVDGCILSMHNIFELLLMPIPGEVDTTQTDTNSLSQIDLERLIAVQPNPTKGEVVVSSPKPLREVAILNPMGQVLYRENYNQKRITLDLSSYPQGVYILHIQTPSGEVRKKVVKR